MHRVYLEFEELTCLSELILRSDVTTDTEVDSALRWYYEHRDTILTCVVALYGIATLIFLTYVVYHVISKLRGNETNVQMNNYGIALAVLGLVHCSFSFTDRLNYPFVNDKYRKWNNNHEELYIWLYWTSDTSYLLYHWFFNLRYVKSTFRLPVLQESAKFFNEMLERILEQREEQKVVLSPKELEDHSIKMAKLKKRQVCQERWADVIGGVFLLLVAVSAFTYVHVSPSETKLYFFMSMYLLIYLSILIAVVVMNLVIKKMTGLLHDENLVLVHVLLFTVMVLLWIPNRILTASLMNAYNTYRANPTNETYLNWTYASASYLEVSIANSSAGILLSLFMLFMLHKFSIFTGFVTDPITG